MKPRTDLQAHMGRVAVRTRDLRPQLADSLSTWRLAEELDGALSGGRVRRVFAVRDGAAVLEVSGAEMRGVFIAWQPPFGRVHLVAEAAPGPREEPFAAALHKLLRGAVVLGVRQMAFDRIVVVDLANLGELGPEERGQLIVETTGRHCNCVLVGPDGRIAAVARPSPRRDDAYRVLAAGEKYVPPPGHEKADPRLLSPATLAVGADAAGVAVGRFLRDRLQGLSNILLAEVCHRAGIEVEEQLGGLPDGWVESWASAMAEVIEEAARGRAWLYFDSAGRPALAYPVRLHHLGELEPEAVHAISEGIAAVGRRIEEDEEWRVLRSALTKAVRKELTRAKKVVEQRQAELARTEEAEKYQRWAELLLANLHELGDAGPGGEVEVVDYYSPDQRRITIPLLPGKNARTTADAYFARHRRLRRAAEVLPGLLQEAERRVQELTERLRRISESDDLEELRELASRQGVLQSPPRHRQEQAAPFGRTVAPSGHTILYGRSAAENDAVLRAASPSDIWLHARGVRGSHVIIRTDGKPEAVPRETLLMAARLAGRLSDYRRDGVADVDYTLARYVRKPRNAPPGFVTYTHQKTLRITLPEE